nr:TFIIA-alpha and beta-like factor [Paramormyrops kingsleyae]
MLSNSNTVSKLYMSVIDDVIESVRELFQDEGIEDRVLEDLRQLWESKVMQSKAVEGFMKGPINPNNFVLQLPANYAQTLHKPTASIVIPAGQTLQNFTTKANGSGALATFSLPPGVSYPVQIPAGVTLQTSSGHLYKVNVPVMVTQAPASNRILPQPIQHVMEPREQVAPQGAVASVAPSAVLQTIPPPAADTYTPAAPSTTLLHPSEPQPVPHQQHLFLGQGGALQPPGALQPQLTLPAVPQPPPLPTPAPVTPDSPGDDEFTLDGIEFSPQPLDMSQPSPFAAQLSSGQACGGQLGAGREEVGQDGGGSLPVNAGEAKAQLVEPAKLEMDLMRDFNYNDLEALQQLDGACDSTSEEEAEEEEVEGGAGADEDEFLGMINAEALKALQEAEGSSEDDGSSSDSDALDDAVEEVEEDPLNSGDDVSEQDVPDLFDTDNVVVCQYDKIHRSKNRWKFYLKDGVMCFGGKDYVFSKAVGEAEW